MKHKEGVVLYFVPGGNKYKVIGFTCGVYRLECVDFWTMEELGDDFHCWCLGETLWVASYRVDTQMTIETSSYWCENGS